MPMKYASKHVIFKLLTLVFLLFSLSFPVKAQTMPQDTDENRKTILAFGDSLTAGYGLLQGQSYPAQMEKELKALGYDVRIVNAGVSGDTTSGGLSRLDWSLKQAKPDLVILALGANDMLRGVTPDVTRANLDGMLDKIKAQGIPVILAGMMAARNMGDVYVKSFDGIYPALAEKHGVTLYPFLLEGVAANPDMNIYDGLHPNEKGVAIMVGGLLPLVRAALDDMK